MTSRIDDGNDVIRLTSSVSDVMIPGALSFESCQSLEQILGMKVES